ncbi:MAG TPA: hypothetical protein VII56_00315 [Rhizomicrobium sp.]
MPVTTVLNDDTTTIVSDGETPRRFSWSAVLAGAFVATAVTLFLLTLGSGVGLSLVTVRHATAAGATTFLTLGAIYFLTAQAFGFAAGGHIVGRLIGPALETDREEEIRAGMHGLVAWALAVVATAMLVALSLLVAGSTTNAVDGALAATGTGGARNDGVASTVTSYWVDTLFRGPQSSVQASLAWRQFAQADTGTATDGSTAPVSTGSTFMTPGDGDKPEPATARVPKAAAPSTGSNPLFMDNTASTGTASAATPVTLTAPRSIAADKAEAGRILTVGMANGGHLTSEDHTQLARLIAQDTGLSLGAAQDRVSDVEARIRHDEVTAAEAARKAASYASLWTALALLFGAVIAVFATISARWEDDREAGYLPGTRVSAVRF